MNDAAQKRLKPLLLAAAAVGAASLFLFYFDPRQNAFYPQCPFHALTGWHCPGCGALRGLHELAHGRIWTALGMNPLVFLGLPLLGCVYWIQKLRLREGLTGSILQKAWVGWALLAAVLLFWILRNIPVYPFTLLAP